MSQRRGCGWGRGRADGTTAVLDAKIATAVVNLAVGVAIGTLIGGVATRSVP